MSDDDRIESLEAEVGDYVDAGQTLITPVS